MSPDKQTSQIFRVVDANLNRLAEGLRVMEEIARLILNNPGISGQLKTMRHDIVRGDLSFNRQLLQSRDASADVGVNLVVPGESKTKDISSILVANARRVQESLRVLEELSKIPELKLDPDKFQAARFDLYTIERELLSGLLRQDKITTLKGLYVIVDSASLQHRSHLEVTRLAIRGGARTIQLRDKKTNKKELASIAARMKEVCAAGKVLFIINDHLDLALAVNADGVHLGQNDLPVAIARKQLPIDMIVGCSATSLDEVEKAQKDGADYIGFGAVYATSTKTDAVITGLKLLRQAATAVQIPIVAIGGINKDNIKDVISAGAAAAAVISAVTEADDPEKATRELVTLINPF